MAQRQKPIKQKRGADESDDDSQATTDDEQPLHAGKG